MPFDLPASTTYRSRRANGNTIGIAADRVPRIIRASVTLACNSDRRNDWRTALIIPTLPDFSAGYVGQLPRHLTWPAWWSVMPPEISTGRIDYRVSRRPHTVAPTHERLHDFVHCMKPSRACRP